MNLTKHAIILIGVILLIGCTGGNGGTKDGSGKLPNSYAQLHAGTEGLRIEFINSAPPDQIFASVKDEEGLPVNIGLRISNKGTSDVADGLITISTDEDYIAISEHEKQLNIKGKSQDNPAGDLEIELFSGTTKRFRDVQSQKRQAQIIATACYKYKTEYVDFTCVDTGVLSPNTKEKICSAADMSSSSQGSPVAVTKVEPKIFPKSTDGIIESVSPEYLITIQNVGTGRVTSPDIDVTALCRGTGIDYETLKGALNTIKVSASLSAQELQCTPSIIKMENNRAQISCRTTEPISASNPTYKAPLKITVDFGYTNIISKQVTIVRKDY